MPDVEVRPLKLTDVSQMARWGRHEDTRFQGYNFTGKNFGDYLSWYLMKRQPFRKWVYGVFADHQLIGYITVKNYRRDLKSAEMGISFNPEWTSKGYGTEAVKQYLSQVFERFKLERVWLKTAAFNSRAKRCYEKAGFTVYDERHEPYEDQSTPIAFVNQWPQWFEYHDELAWINYIYMEIRIDELKNNVRVNTND